MVPNIFFYINYFGWKMICNVIDKDNYILKIYNCYNDVDIYDHDNIE